MKTNNRLIQEFIFDCYVNKRLSLSDTLSLFKLSNLMTASSIKFAESFYHKFSKNKISKDIFIKLGSFEETVINRFAMNKKDSAFLPQTELAKIFNVTQKTISVWLNRMCNEGYIKLEKTYRLPERKANEYRLLSKAMIIFDKLITLTLEKTSKVMDITKKVFKLEKMKTVIVKGSEYFNKEFNGFYDENGKLVETKQQAEERKKKLFWWDTSKSGDIPF